MSQVSLTCDALTMDALARVLECDASTLRTDMSLSALGVDSVALVLWADVMEEALRQQHGFDVVVPDSILRAVRSIGDLSAGLEPVVHTALARALGHR